MAEIKAIIIKQFWLGKVSEFQENHRLVWKDIKVNLNDETILIVELFELVTG